jgi:2',3'-cyclic-nucleotide 2'-phosphodiesterase (5'-nucleotidase family)
LNFAMNDEKWWELDATEYSTQSFMHPDEELAIASVPNNICLEWAPGSGTSEVCSLTETNTKGGGACDLVAWALLDQNLRAQMAILKAGDCGSDLPSGSFTESDASALLPGNPTLVTMKVTGAHVVALLEEAVNATLQEEGARADAYPYAAALRFNVNAIASLGNRISSVQVFNIYNRWVQLERDGTYTILTTTELATGEDPAYQTLLQADTSTIRDTRLGSVDTLIKYALEWKLLFAPPYEKYSTQSYIS